MEHSEWFWKENVPFAAHLVLIPSLHANPAGRQGSHLAEPAVKVKLPGGQIMQALRSFEAIWPTGHSAQSAAEPIEPFSGETSELLTVPAAQRSHFGRTALAAYSPYSHRLHWS